MYKKVKPWMMCRSSSYVRMPRCRHSPRYENSRQTFRLVPIVVLSSYTAGPVFALSVPSYINGVYEIGWSLLIWDIAYFKSTPPYCPSPSRVHSDFFAPTLILGEFSPICELVTDKPVMTFGFSI